MSDTRHLTYKCPDCGAKLARVEGMSAATQVVKRTCPACRQRWQAVIAPVKIAQGWADVGTLARL